MLQKTTNGITTKYVYGLGLIGEEKCGEFKVYHFDYRGSTVAITDINGNITDTFKYDTYGNVTEHIGNSFVIFGYNGRDGVVTDKNGLLYMRARYYSPDMRRFINADIISGEISNAITLNRYAYANGNPVSNTDPFGLSAERGGTTIAAAPIHPTNIPNNILSQILYASSLYKSGSVNIHPFYYSEDYKNDATVTNDKNGNIIYTFSNYYDGLTHDNLIVTKYYFKVEDASYWQDLLDFKIKDFSKLYDNGFLRSVDELAEFLTVPGGGIPVQIEFGATMYQFVREFMTPEVQQKIEHNSSTSDYLFDKVAYKDPKEKVTILTRAETYNYTKFFWQDSFSEKLTAERTFVE